MNDTEKLAAFLELPQLQDLTCIQLAKRSLAQFKSVSLASSLLLVDMDKIRTSSRELYDFIEGLERKKWLKQRLDKTQTW